MCKYNNIEKDFLRSTIEQETKSYRHFLTKAEAAESCGDVLLESEYRVCAEISREQAEMAKRVLAEIEEREDAEFNEYLEEREWRKQSGDGVYAK